MNKPNTDKVLLAFDVGARRIGVAKATVPPRVAQPLMTLIQDEMLTDSLRTLMEAERPDALVVGLPRNQSGDTTAQTREAESWVQNHLTGWQLPIYWQDESLTSVAAEAHIATKGKRGVKGDIDSLAASIILTDFLETMDMDRM